MYKIVVHHHMVTSTLQLHGFALTREMACLVTVSMIAWLCLLITTLGSLSLTVARLLLVSLTCLVAQFLSVNFGDLDL